MKGRFLFDQIDFVCKRNSSVLFSITLYMLLGVSRAWAARVEAKGVSFGHVSSAIAAAKDAATEERRGSANERGFRRLHRAEHPVALYYKPYSIPICW